MNNTSILELEKEKKLKLEKYELDDKSLQIFQNKIKKVSQNESDKLGQEMFEMIAKKGFNDNFEKVIEYIYKGANIEYKNATKGDFALLVCARKGYFKTFLALIKAGANVNQSNNFNTTATMAAARHGYYDMLELLIIMGADINICCKDGDNALISAKRHDQTKCFDLLVRNNANIFHRNLMNESVIEIKSSKPFDLSLFEKTVPEKVKKGASEEEVDNLLKEAEESLKKILEKK